MLAPWGMGRSCPWAARRMHPQVCSGVLLTLDTPGSPQPPPGGPPCRTALGQLAGLSLCLGFPIRTAFFVLGALGQAVPGCLPITSPPRGEVGGWHLCQPGATATVHEGISCFLGPATPFLSCRSLGTGSCKSLPSVSMVGHASQEGSYTGPKRAELLWV